MKREVRNLIAAAAVCMSSMAALGASPGTSFTYQGRLTDGGAPANGAYDLQVRMFNSSLGGLQQGPTLLLNNQPVVNGVFTASLDFGTEFDGKALWVEIDVRPGSSVGAYTPIFPRTKLEATPFAQALNLPVAQTGVVTDGLLSFTNQSTDDAAFVMKLTSGAASGNTPGIGFQPVLILDTNDGNGLASYTSKPNAYAAYLSNSGNGGAGLVISNISTTSGYGVRADMTAGTNTGNTIDAGNSGLGRAAFFTVTNASNATNAVEILTNGNSTSQALRVAHSGTGDNALFEITNAGNQGEAVEAHTVGTGNAGYFQVDNTSSSTPALFGTTNGSSGIGVSGVATGSFSYGVKGTGLSAGVRGECGTTNGSGVYGVTNAAGGGSAAGVRGDGSAAGVAGGAFYNNQGTGLYAQSTSGTAGFFSGNVTITGSLQVNGAKNFKIDHPLDPANKFLVHASVESPEMKNIYDGVVVIGADGTATVKMPSYFGALNTEFRYQLTCIGGHAPVYVAEEISQNQFKIAGGKPGMKVSWQVTGVRSDATAISKPMQVEVQKAKDEIGRYLNPEAFGQSPELQIDPMSPARVSKMN